MTTNDKNLTTISIDIEVPNDFLVNLLTTLIAEDIGYNKYDVVQAITRHFKENPKEVTVGAVDWTSIKDDVLNSVRNIGPSDGDDFGYWDSDFDDYEDDIDDTTNGVLDENDLVVEDDAPEVVETKKELEKVTS